MLTLTSKTIQIRGVLLLWRAELLHKQGRADQADRAIEQATAVFEEEPAQPSSCSICLILRFQLALSRQVR